MGESFSTNLSTGVVTFSVAISLPAARGQAQPSLALSYSSGGGHGLAGVGWDIGVPFIARQTDRGTPGYQDPAPGGGWTPQQDRFIFNGGQELVPICLVAGNGSCVGAQPNELMPTWAAGWQYFRPRVEGSFFRVFWSPDHQTWRVQSKSGVTMELGLPLACVTDSTTANALESDPNTPGNIYRWNIACEYDAQVESNPPAGASPRPVNVVAYRYTQSGNVAYLSDIYDTPPASGPASAALSAYAHHTRILYQPRTDTIVSFRRGWQTNQTLRVLGIDVTSMPFSAGSGTSRELLRRYHLTYDPTYHSSFLTSVLLEGRCAQAVQEDGTQSLPSGTGCPGLPATTFQYQHVTPLTIGGQPGVADLAGFEGFNEQVQHIAASPNYSVDGIYTDLLISTPMAFPTRSSRSPLTFRTSTGCSSTAAPVRRIRLRPTPSTSRGFLARTPARLC